LYSATAAYLSLTERYEPLEHSYTTHKLAHTLTALQEQLAELPLEMLQDPDAAYLPRIEDIVASCSKAPAVVLDGMVQVSNIQLLEVLSLSHFTSFISATCCCMLLVSVTCFSSVSAVHAYSCITASHHECSLSIDANLTLR
jgi:hypothetical protein